MSRKQQSDSVVVWDRASRRQFMRAGAGFLLVGGALTASRGVRADDCDRNGQQRESSADQDAGFGKTEAGKSGCRPIGKSSKVGRRARHRRLADGDAMTE